MKKIRKPQKVDIYIYLLILLHSLVFTFQHYSVGHNPLVYAEFGAIGVLSFCGILCERATISIQKIVCIFSYIFFFMAPWQQYSEGAKAMWPGVFLNYTDELHFKANASILLFLLFFLFTSKFYKRSSSQKSERQGDQVKLGMRACMCRINLKVRAFLTILPVATVFILLVTGNLQGGRGTLVGNENIDFQILSMLRFTPGYALLYYGAACNESNPKDRIRSVFQYKENYVNAFLFIIIYNPFYGWASRTLWMVPVTILFAAFFYDSKMESLLFFIMYVGLVVLFTPLKGMTLSSFNLRDFENVNLNYFDYDAYQLLMTIIAYTDAVGQTFGRNLISAIAFLIPRSIWTGKMDSTGALANVFFGARQRNVSAPIVAELYFAGKYWGCAIGAAILAFLFSHIDEWRKSESFVRYGIFCILAGEILFICRGALLATLSFALGMMLPLGVLAVCTNCLKHDSR